MASNNELKYEDSRTFRHWLRELCLRGLPRNMFSQPRAFDKILLMAQTWLSKYLYGKGYRTARRHFIALDGRDFDENPLALCMKTREFKPSQLIVHLAILRLLDAVKWIPFAWISMEPPSDVRRERHWEGIHLLSDIPQKCIRETFYSYAEIGLLERRRVANRDEFRIRRESFALAPVREYLAFWAAMSPMELAGSIVRDRCIRQSGKIGDAPFRCKFRYFHHILDAEVIEIVLEGIRGRHPIVIQMACTKDADAKPHALPKHFELKTVGKTKGHTTTVIPIKIYASVLTGRRYLMGLFSDSLDFACIRLDRIDQATPETDEKGNPIWLDENRYRDAVTRFSAIAANLWGVSYHDGAAGRVHVSFEVHDPRPNAPKVKRLAKERRCGTVTEIAPDRARFEADVHDGREMFPWIRTYVGYLSNLSFSDAELTKLFWKQLQEVREKWKNRSNQMDCSEDCPS